MTGDGRRPRRIAERLRSTVGQALNSELADPRLRTLVVTRVDVTPDLSLAWVYVRQLSSSASAGGAERAVKALQGAAQHLRRSLAPELKLKRVPELRFRYDDAPDQRARVDELLKEIAEDAASPAPDESSDPE